LAVKELCRRHGFSEAGYYLSRSKFGGMTVSEAKRLRELDPTPHADRTETSAENAMRPSNGGASDAPVAVAVDQPT